MRRRTFLTAGAAVAGALAAPRVARSQESKILRFIPQVDLPLLDPVTNSGKGAYLVHTIEWENP